MHYTIFAAANTRNIVANCAVCLSVSVVDQVVVEAYKTLVSQDQYTQIMIHRDTVEQLLPLQ